MNPLIYRQLKDTFTLSNYYDSKDFNTSHCQTVTFITFTRLSLSLLLPLQAYYYTLSRKKRIKKNITIMGTCKSTMYIVRVAEDSVVLYLC